jgi:cyanophycinase-like exopeptidase
MLNLGGTSAGCVGLTSNYMITGYETTSYQALRDGSSSDVEQNKTMFTYDSLGGLGFFAGYILDVHFG